MSSIERRGSGSYQAFANLKYLIEEWALRDANEIKRSCASCTYAKRSGPFSCSKYSVVPPIDVIMNGCDGYSDCDDVPF